MPLVGTQGSAYPYPSTRSITTSGRRGVMRGMSAAYHQTWAAPTAVVTNGLITATPRPNTATFTHVPGTAPFTGTLVSGNKAVLLPTYGPWTGSRNVVITVTHGSAVVALSGLITGVDVYGNTIVEAWSVTAGGTTKTFTGVKAFKNITSITAVAAADATLDTIIAGDGNVLGLDVRNETPGAGAALKELVDGALVTTGTLTAIGVTSGYSSAFAADPRGTYAPATAPNGAHNYDVWVLSDDPEFSAS